MKPLTNLSICSFILALIAMNYSSDADAQRGPQSFDFAYLEIDGWALRAKTAVRWSGDADRTQLPSVSSVECYGRGPDAQFSMDGEGDVAFFRLDFPGPPDEEGERNDAIVAGGDHLWLYVDEERWEYANFPWRWGFVDITYPARGEVVAIGNTYPVVRKSENGPWTNFSRVYESLIAADRIEWGFRSRDWNVIDQSFEANRLPEGWESSRYPIDTQGLEEAVSWCAEQVMSEAAYTLPDHIKQQVGVDAQTN